MDTLPAPAHLAEIYERRFASDERERRNKMWQVLCRHFFQRYVRSTDTVLDLGAGYCEFINNINCSRRIAVDLSPHTLEFARPDVEVVSTRSDDLSHVASDTVDIVFVSNFFEHLPDKQVFMATLREIRRILKSGGRVLILQPNIRVLGGRYWDFIDHYIPLTDRTMVEALELIDMLVAEVRARFLPYTTKSRLAKFVWLLRYYLLFPPAHWIFGGQAFVVGVKP